MKAILSLLDATLLFGGKPLMNKWRVHLHEQDHVCLVGKNGSGKSTLLKILASQIELDQGKLYKQPGLRVGYLPQRLVNAKPNQTALDYVLQFATEDYLADVFLTQLKIPFDKSIEAMSGGEQRRLSLAAVLSLDSDVMLLDEPTNHLDITSIEWLENYLMNFKGSFIVISHDRQFSKAVSNKTWWIDRAILHQNNKGFEAFDAWSEEIWQQEECAQALLDTKLRQEAQWMLRGVTARRKRNQGRLKKVYALREERRQMYHNARQSIAATHFHGSGQSQLILEAHGIVKTHHETCLIKDFNLRLLRGDRMGIIGPNGCGKSTLIRLLTGELKPDEGSIKRNDDLKFVYLDQMQIHLDLQKSVMDNLCSGGGDHVIVDGQSRHVVAYLKDFLFSEEQIRGMTHILSGGERNRLALAKGLTQPCDVLILDEPTNDLDSETLDLLLEILLEFKGTLLIVSHDRDFLDQLTTSLIAFDGQGHVREYIGGYQDYLRQRIMDTPPKKIKKESASREQAFKKSQAEPLKVRFSYREKQDYEHLPQKIDRLEKDIQSLHQKLNDPALYLSNPKEFEAITHNFTQKKEEKDQAEIRWLELDEKMNGSRG